MIPLTTEAEVRRLYFAEHWKKGTIVEQLDVHVDVVDRVIGHLGPAPLWVFVMGHARRIVDLVPRTRKQLRHPRPRSTNAPPGSIPNGAFSEALF